MHLILLGTFLSDAGPQEKVNRPGITDQDIVSYNRPGYVRI